MKKILIIDDDQKIQAYLVFLFKDNGFAVVTAGDVSGGLAVAKKEKPDLITLDLDLPGDWGPRFYRRLSEDPELKNTPVIVISGLSGNQYAIGKAVASFGKPFDQEQLLATVRETLGD